MSTHISIQDAADKLGVSTQRVRELCRDNKIDAKKESR